MSSTKSANADVLPSPHPSSVPSSMFRVRRRPSELAAAISRTAKIREDAATLRFELKLRSDGTFGSDNVALVSCHGDTSKGFRYKFHVSGAADTSSSQPDKDTPNEDALTFAATMNDVFRDNEEELTKAAQYTVNTLGKPLKKGEKSPHARNAAVSIAALLESYYVAAADIVGQNRKWKFRGTENEICNVESDATEASYFERITLHHP